MTQPRKRKYDLTLLAVLLALLVFGLIILYSTSAYNGEVKFHDSFYYLKKQVFATLLGILGMYLAARRTTISGNMRPCRDIWRRSCFPWRSFS